LTGRGVRRYPEIPLHLDRYAGDAQILKARAEEGDRRHITFERVFGDGLAHDAVGREHFHHVEPFDNGGGQGVPARARLVALDARNVWE
jgi:hypothetical protein